MFDLKNLFLSVFHPEPGERVAVLTDGPRNGLEDHPAWAERRAMAAAWRDGIAEVGREAGLDVLPLVTFPATGAHNADLPLVTGSPLLLEEALGAASLALALTQFSATAPLVAWSRAHADFRAASLPEAARRMERTALSADYGDVARRCRALAEALEGAELARVRFSTGHEWEVDLRHRQVRMDDGQLPRHKPGGRVINLPSGETFQAPYEGEREGDPSRTRGEVPVVQDGERVVLKVEANRIVQVRGSGRAAGAFRALFGEDRARGNVAEFAIGCNPKAVVWGNVLEDEKAGFHWAYGRSEHLGGVVGPERFRSPSTIVHQDVVYAKGSPVDVSQLSVFKPGGPGRTVIRDGQVVVF